MNFASRARSRLSRCQACARRPQDADQQDGSERCGGTAQIVRTGWYRSVHVKSFESYRARALLGARIQLIGMTTRLSNHIRGVLKTFAMRGLPFDRKVEALLLDRSDGLDPYTGVIPRMPADQNGDLFWNRGALTRQSLSPALSTTQMAVIFCETSNPTKWVIDQPPTVRITGQCRPDRGTIDKSRADRDFRMSTYDF